MNKDSDDQAKITIALLISGSLGIIGSFFIMIVYKALNLKLFAFRLVVYIAITDLVHSACLLLPLTDPWCEIQAILLEWSSVSNILWTALMAYSLYEAVIKLNPNVEEKEKIYLIIGFGIPCIITGIPMIDQSYGYSQGWCWITSKDTNFIYRLCCFYFILVAVFIYNTIVYYIVWKKVKSEVLIIQDEEAAKLNQDLVMRLKLYPVVLICCYSAVLVKRVYESVYPDGYNYWLAFISGLMMGLLGFGDALVYGFTREVRVGIKKCCCPRKVSRSMAGISIPAFQPLVVNN